MALTADEMQYYKNLGNFEVAKHLEKLLRVKQKKPNKLNCKGLIFSVGVAGLISLILVGGEDERRVLGEGTNNGRG